jgi:glutaredoxin-like YruB-family protein
MTIKIFSTPFCGYCKLLKQYLDDNKIAYQEIDVAVDLKAQEEMVAKSGQMGVPVTIIEKDGQEEIIVGFQKSKVAEILNLTN